MAATPISPPAPAATARAWVFAEAGAPMTLHELPLPPPASLLPHDVLVRLTCATVCNSDVHTIDGKRTDPAAPLVLGHEGVGVVVAGGAACTLAAGARVTWGVATSCGACPPCAEWGVPQKCVRVKKYGHAPWGVAAAGSADPRPETGLSGTYASHILLTEGTTIVALPTHVSDALASPVNCALATMVAAVLRAGPLRDGPRGHPAPPLRSALVQGAGMLGLYGVALLKLGLGLACAHADAAGALPPYAHAPPFVAVTDVAPARLALARRFGADAAVDVSGAGDDATFAALMAALTAHEAARAPGGTPPVGFDLVVEVCGSSGVVPLGLRLLRPGGEYAFVGQVHPGTPLAGVTGDAVIRKCATLRGVHNYGPDDLVDAVAFLGATAGVLPYAALVSAPPLPLDDLPAAIAEAKRGTYARVAVAP